MMLGYLEPRHEEARTILINELDEFNEIIFVTKGDVAIGYEINKVKKYCIKYTDRAVIGGYGVTFNNRSAFIYAALTDINGYSIRKCNWFKLCEENPEIHLVMK